MTELDMYFIQVMGRHSRLKSADTLAELGKIVTKELADRANDCIVISIGLDDSAVMPYVWIHRNNEDVWEGELGDCIKLGIKAGSLVEKDPIQMLSLDQAVARGIAEVYDDGIGQVISIQEIPVAKPKATKKLSNDEKVLEARRMVKILFTNIRKEDD